jgi:hypothetical protein
VTLFRSLPGILGQQVSTSIVAHFDAADLAGADASTVSSWVDKTGNYTLTQPGSSTLYPTLQTNVANGRNVVRFDGSNDFMQCNDLATAISDLSQWTLVVALRCTADGDNEYALSFGHSTDADVIVGAQQSGATRSKWVTAHRSDNNNSVPSTFEIPSQYAAVMVISRDGSNITKRCNASEVVTATTDPTTAMNRFTLGALGRASVANYAPCEVAEVAVFSASYADAEVTEMEAAMFTRYGVGTVSATDDVISIDMTNAETLVLASSVTNASELREQDSIVHDPDDPNLGTYPEREYKLYFSATVSGDKRIYVAFSADGATFGTPTACTMGGSNRQSEDPSAVTLLATPGQVYRDGSDVMYLYCEDSSTSDVYVYSSTDGMSFTEMSSNPAIARGAATAWDETLVGSPVALHDGTDFIVGYEGINASTVECLGVASGATANGLTKSANNPVWTGAADPVATNSIVSDTILVSGGVAVVFAHVGTSGVGNMFRGVSSVTDPTAWVSGDIVTSGYGDLASTLKNDLTLDYSDTSLSTVVTGASDDQSLVRASLFGVKPWAA